MRWGSCIYCGIELAPAEFDVDDLARIIGAWRHVEFISDGELRRSFHFPGEVLVLDEFQPFPWQLVELDDWALLTEASGLDQ